MYFIISIFVAIIFFAILLLNLVKIILKPQKELYKKLLNIVVYIIAFATLINILITAYSFFKTKDKIAQIGDKGIRGPKGKTGRKGICDDKCGQKVCYISVVEHAHKIFNKEMKKLDNSHTKEEIQNTYLLNKINEICSSDKYMSIITQKFKKKPTEKKLIEYLKKIIEEWIILFIKYNPDSREDLNDHLGVKFLRNKNFTPDILNNPTYNENIESNPSPFFYLKKYDIYNWGEKDYYSQKKIEIESNNIEYPLPDLPKLYIMKTNNYTRVYTSKMKKDLWSTQYCLFNQMGSDRTNPKNLKKCVFINPNTHLKEYKNTWKTHAYDEPPELSLYNVKPFKTKNNHKFYPVGSVWAGKVNEDDTKKEYAERLPKSKNFCGSGQGLDQDLNHSNSGPVKETILVSGDVVDPEDFELLWDSTRGCSNCQQSDNSIKIYRPIPPEGYICLGDVAANSKQEAMDLQIKCIPEKYLQKIRMGPMVWNNKIMKFSKFNNYTNYTKNKPHFFKKPVSMTLFSAGASNIFEERQNNVNIDLEDDGGYNLFRINAGKGYNKTMEDMPAYKIKHKYLQRANGKVPKNIKLKMTNVDPPIKRLTDDMYFGNKPQNAILTNIHELDSAEQEKSILDFEEQPKRLYLIDDKNKRKENKSDTYFIKTYNKKKNNYSSCLTTNTDKDGNGYVTMSNSCDNSNPSHLWKIKHNTGTQATMSQDISLESANVFESDTGVSNKLCLYHNYDNLGKDQFTLNNCDTANFRYDTFIADELPQYFDS